jgi:hypothetical protein
MAQRGRRPHPERVIRCRRCRDLRQEGERFFNGLCDTCRQRRSAAKRAATGARILAKAKEIRVEERGGRRSELSSCRRNGGTARTAERLAPTSTRGHGGKRIGRERTQAASRRWVPLSLFEVVLGRQCLLRSVRSSVGVAPAVSKNRRDPGPAKRVCLSKRTRCGIETNVTSFDGRERNDEEAAPRRDCGNEFGRWYVGRLGARSRQRGCR